MMATNGIAASHHHHHHHAMAAGTAGQAHMYHASSPNGPYAYGYDPTLLNDAVFVLYSAGADAQCGLVCCENQAVTCNQPPFLPEELNGVMSMDEFNELCSNLNKVFKATVLPMMPCILTHFCLPFSPICAMYHYQGKRREGVAQVLDAFNKRYLIERGAYFEPIEFLNFSRFVAKLKVRDRAAYEAGRVSSLPAAPVSAAMDTDRENSPLVIAQVELVDSTKLHD